MAATSAESCADSAKLRVNRITPPTSGCSSSSRSSASISGPARSIMSGPRVMWRQPLTLSAGLKERNRLDVRGMREHVHHSGRLERKAVVVNQHPHIPRKTARMARNIQHPFRGNSCDGPHYVASTGARRIEQHMAEAAREPGQIRGQRLRKVGCDECGVSYSVEMRIMSCTLDEPRLPFDAEHFGCPSGERQREITETAVQVEHARSRCQLEQRDRPADQRRIHGRVHLHEVRRLKLDPHRKLREPVIEWIL